MKRCRVLIPDAGPFNSLWVADALDILLKLDMPITVVDAVFDEMTFDPSYQKDREVKDFIEGHQPPFSIIETDIGQAERQKRQAGLPVKKNAGEIAIADFLSSETGLDAWIDMGDPVLIITEDMRAARRIFLPEPNVHTLGTIGLLKGMEKAGLIPSANAILKKMKRPTAPGRKLSDRRQMTEPEDGLDIEAEGGSSWTPEL